MVSPIPAAAYQGLVRPHGSQLNINKFFDDDHPKYHKAGPICFKGKAGWDSRLAAYAGSLEQINHAFNQVGEGFDTNMHVIRTLMFIVQCPECDKQSPSHNYDLQYTNLDLKMKCRECSNSLASKIGDVIVVFCGTLVKCTTAQEK